MFLLLLLLVVLGCALLVILAVLWSRITAQARSIEQLRRSLQVVLERLHALDPLPRGGQASAPPTGTTVRPPVTPAGAAPGVARPAVRVARSRGEWEALIGGKWLNRIGALAFILGVGFFLKYAFDNDWISETLRVLTGGVAGVLLLLGAWRSHARGYRIFSQGLVGAGISVLYLSVYASFNFYQIIPEPAAYILMCAVTVTAFHQALRYDSLATALIGWAGGFLTPYLLTAGEPGQPGLFTYLALLTAAVLAITAAREAWGVLRPLTIAATYLTYFLWFARYYDGGTPMLTGFFLTMFWALFLALEIAQQRTRQSPLQAIGEILSGLNALLYLAGMYRLMMPDYREWGGPLMLLISGVYAGIFLWDRQEQAPKGVPARVLLTAVLFLVVGTEIQFDGFAAVIAWSAVGCGLLWAGARWGLRPLAWSGAGLLVLNALRVLLVRGALVTPDPGNFTVLFNERAQAFIALIAAALAGASFLRRTGGNAAARAARGLAYLGVFLLVHLVSVELNDAFRQRMAGAADAALEGLSFLRLMVVSLAWMTTSLALAVATAKNPRGPVASAGLVLALLALIPGIGRGIAFSPPAEFVPLVNVRSLILLLLGAGMAVHLRQARSPEAARPGWLRAALGATLVILALTLVTGETRDYFRREAWITGETTIGEGRGVVLAQIENQKQLSLSAAWLLSSIVIMGLGLWSRTRGLRVISIALFGFTILKIFIYDLSFLDTQYRVVSFLGLGVILLGVSFLYQRYKQLIVQ